MRIWWNERTKLKGVSTAKSRNVCVGSMGSDLSIAPGPGEPVNPDAFDAVGVFVREDDVVQSSFTHTTSAWNRETAFWPAIRIEDDVLRW